MTRCRLIFARLIVVVLVRQDLQDLQDEQDCHYWWRDFRVGGGASC